MRIRRLVWTAVVAAAATVAGCAPQDTVDAFVPKAEGARAQQIVQQLQARDFAAIEAALDPSLSGRSEVRARLQGMADALPSGPPKSVHPIGAFTHVFNGTRFVSLTYEYEFPDRWVVAQVQLRDGPGRQDLTALNVERTTDSQARLNAFVAPGKGLWHAGALAWTALVPAFIVATLALLARTPMPRRWLWAIVILLGVGQWSFNWTTGETGYKLFNLQLLGSAFFKPPFGPLILISSVPLGAIVYLWKRRQWRAR